MLDILKSSLEEAPVVKKGDYDYVVHPITDGVPEISPALLREIINEIKNLLVKGYDKLVTVEAMGLPIGAILALELNKPLVVIRKKSYGLEGEVSVEQVTGYSKSKLFINGLEADDKVVLVDDVISTGGTLLAVINALYNIGVDIVDIVIVIEKGEGKGYVEQETGVDIKTLVKVDVIDGRVVATDV